MKINIWIFCLFSLVTNIPESKCNEIVFKKAFELLHREPFRPLTKYYNNVVTKRIEQKLDNFNEDDSRTWKMRYMENGKHFKSGGPIFIVVGGEWEISPGFLQSGHFYDMATKYNGYLFYTEHRYYGKSFPTKDLSVENLKYLSVDQSLADLAHFIETIKRENEDLKNSKVVLTGGSYAGTMVTWFQRKYPGLAVGSWASSAPLLAKVDFIEYYEIVGQSIALVGGQSCYDKIANYFKQLEHLMKTNSSHILKRFNICDNFDATNKLDIWSFFNSISGFYGGLVQNHISGNIEKVCNRKTTNDAAVDEISKQILSRYLSKTDCNDFSYSSNVKQLKNTDNRSIARQWDYQTCAEFGWFQTSGSKHQPFGSSFPVDFFISLCEDVYGKRFSNSTIHQNIKDTNEVYGGLNPNVKNVVFTHGQLDPWRAVGLQESNGESHVIPLHAHCTDYGSISKNDTVEMRAAKQRVQRMVEKWLKDDTNETDEIDETGETDETPVDHILEKSMKQLQGMSFSHSKRSEIKITNH